MRRTYPGRKKKGQETHLLPEPENLEALKVGQVLPPVGTLGLLGVVALGPLAIDLVLLPQLLDGTSAGRARELGNDEVGEGGVVESEDVTGDDLLLFGGRTVNEDLFDILVSAVFFFFCSLLLSICATFCSSSMSGLFVLRRANWIYLFL